jgi:hypothetical protein
MDLVSKMLKASRNIKNSRCSRGLAIATLTSIILFIGQAEVRDSGISQLIGLQPATAQFSIPPDAGQQVYQRLPNLPLENQYVSRETGKVDVNSTLVSRLMRYHIFVKKRPANYRFDWKLTLADYLGVNEYLVESEYPGSNTLRENPMAGDRLAIAKLNRTERNALVNVLVSVFSPNTPPTPAPAPSASPSPSITPNPSTRPSLPKPGDAQLLLP